METAASIIAILQLSDKVIKYVRDVSGATEDRKRLREQVRACSSILLMLKDGIEDSEEGQAWAGTVDLLAPPLERLRKALELAAVRLHTETSTKEKLKWPFKEKEVQKFIEAIESEKSLLSLALENNSARLLQQIGIRSLNNSAHLEELTTLLKEHALDSENRHRDLKSKVSTVQDTQISLQKDRSASEEAEKRLKIIEWLSPLDHDAQQHDIISQRQVGTGDWFLNSVQYQEWLETKGGVLFCPGIPGAGKSFLASIAIADVCERYHQDSCIATTFFYFDFRRQQTIENAISSLLKQLVEGATQLSQSIEAYFDHYCKRRTRPLFADVVVAFREELRSYQQVFVIIDALDESQASADLVSTVLDLQRIKQFNLLATSRPLPEISAQFADVVVLPIRATHQDVQTYLEAHIRRLPGFVKSNAKLQEEITESIVRSVQGMFLLAKLHIEALVGKRSVAAVRKSLSAINTGTEAYDAAYSTVMERIGSQATDQVELAHDVLAWIVHARRRVTAMELQQALGVEIGKIEFDSDNCPDIDYIVSVCAGLIAIDHGTNIIRLAHYTAQEYFEKNQLKWFPDAEARIANVCTTYLSFLASRATLVPQSQSERQVLPAASGFYNYAALNWGHHARVAPATLAETMRLLRQSRWVEIAWPTVSWSPESVSGIHHSTKCTGLHLAAYFGLEVAAGKLVQGISSPERQESHDITPVMIAALRGHKFVVELLLDHKVDVAPNLSKLTPLYFAARGGHRTIVQRLLEYGPTIEEDLGLYEPLYGANTSGYDHVVKLLLEHYSSRPMSTIQYLRVLSCAMEHDYDAIVDSLLSKKDPPNFANMGPRSELLLQATKRNNLRVVQFLLDNDMPAYNYKSPPLHAAARLGQVAIGSALLQAGADITSLNDRHEDALHLALEGGQVAFVKMMLDYHANMQKYTKRSIPNSEFLKGIDNKPLLFNMVSKERKVPVKTLLEAGADPNYIHTSGQSPLHAACLHHSFGYTTILQLLIDAGAEVDKRDDFGRTPLHIACIYRSYSCEKIVKFILDADANVNAQDHFGKSALHMACTNEHENLVKLLLDNGADVHCADIYGNSPLHTACRWEDEAIAKLLMGAGAVVKCQNKLGDSPLHYACWGGSEAVVKLLLEAGADVWCTNSGGESPFDDCRSQGHKAIMRLLLGHGQQEYQLPWTTHHSWPTEPTWSTNHPWPTHAPEVTHKLTLRL